MNYQKQGYQTVSPPTDRKKPRTRKPKKKNSRSTLSTVWKVMRVILLLVLIGGVVFGVNWYNAYRETKRYDGIFPDNISIDGISLGGMTLQQGYDALVSRAVDRQNSWTLDLTYNGHLYYTLNNDSLGIRTSMQEIYDMVMDAYSIGHTGSAFQRRDELKALETKPYERYTTQSRLSTDYLDQILNAIAADMYMEPQDAYLAAFNPDAADPFTIVSEQPGRSLDTATAKTRILAMASSGESGTLELEPTPLEANITTADVRSGVALISTGTTPISTSSTENRNNNIRVAFSRFNGLVVPSGGRVSFNDTVGERTKANGFYEADEYVYGDLVVGVGGGVCQASSTIYKAVLTANLKVNKREPHSELVSYTTFGQDATVYWGGRKIDFVFTNSSVAPIYITAHVEKTGRELQCVVRIYGKSLGTSYYTLDTRTVEIIPQPEEPEYIKDTRHDYVTYTDEQYQIRTGREGFINETYLLYWENGVFVSEMLVSRDVYEAKADCFYVGTLTPQILE